MDVSVAFSLFGLWIYESKDYTMYIRSSIHAEAPAPTTHTHTYYN